MLQYCFFFFCFILRFLSATHSFLLVSNLIHDHFPELKCFCSPPFEHLSRYMAGLQNVKATVRTFRFPVIILLLALCLLYRVQVWNCSDSLDIIFYTGGRAGLLCEVFFFFASVVWVHFFLLPEESLQINNSSCDWSPLPCDEPFQSSSCVLSFRRTPPPCSGHECWANALTSRKTLQVKPFSITRSHCSWEILEWRVFWCCCCCWWWWWSLSNPSEKKALWRYGFQRQLRTSCTALNPWLSSWLTLGQRND